MYHIKHIQENHHNNNNHNFILTIKHANKGRDVRLGIDDNDTLQSVNEFLFNNKNDFDDLRECEECKENIYLIRYRDDQYELFDSSDFNEMKRDNQHQNVIIFTIAPIQVNYNGKTHDIRCLPDVSSVRDEMIKIYPALKKFRDIGYIAMPLEIIEGEFIKVRSQFLPNIAKGENNKRVLKMSVLTNDQLKPMILNSTIDGVSLQPIKSIGDNTKIEIIKNKLQLVETQFTQLQNELEEANQRKSGLKAVLNIDPPFSNNTYDFSKFLYTAKEGWYDIVEVTDGSMHNIQGMLGEVLIQLSLLPIKKIVLSLNAYALRQMNFLKFLEVTTIPMIDLNSPDWRMMKDTADAIEKNENIMHFKGLDSYKNNKEVLRINEKLRRNRERKAVIRRVNVGAGKDVDNIMRRF